ncbi:MAG: cob(I)yrinic acid a,c-diamide adenosyltransferase [Chthoniobacteraceae bacterium]|nr:cob(I)yrinic acid a,c-diamide adenosyltransferase [Chthoniobacteraceae bacterium]
MSIATQTGDQGDTSLLFGKRVPKTDPHIRANGAVDELSARLGLARASLKGTPGDPFITGGIFAIQKELVTVMGQIAVAPGDHERHAAQFPVVTPAMTDALTGLVHDLEQNHKIEFHRWATPGDCMGCAAIDLARTACRSAERDIIALRETDPDLSAEIPRYLNRLSDLLWLWARWVETKEAAAASDVPETTA